MHQRTAIVLLLLIATLILVALLLLLLLLLCRARQLVASCSNASVRWGRLDGLRSQHGDEET
jgi:uncharacterized membrane protein YqiK